MHTTLLQVVPGAPPQVNGVGDFAFAVARALRERKGIDSAFLVCHPDWREERVVDGFRCAPCPERDAAAFVDAARVLAVRAGGGDRMLLQLSPYGFDASGAPAWLRHGVQRWRAARPSARLVTYFHELHAGGAPWRKSFWLAPLQKACVRAIARLSDEALSNLAQSAARLDAWRGAGRSSTTCLPVVSTVGEPESMTDWHARSPQVVIWASGAARDWAYSRFAPWIGSVVNSVAARAIIDVGTHAGHVPERIAGVPVRRAGLLPGAELSALLGDSRLGIFPYNPNVLGKSTLFAAFSAHRVPTLVLPQVRTRSSRNDGLDEGVHFLASDPARAPTLPWHVMAGRAQDWYLTHDTARHAAAVARAFEIADSPNA